LRHILANHITELARICCRADATWLIRNSQVPTAYLL